VVQDPYDTYTITGTDWTTLHFNVAPVSGKIIAVHQGEPSLAMVPQTGSVTIDSIDSGLKNFSFKTFTGDGTTTVFTLDEEAGNSQSLLVSIEGVIQRPIDNYTVSGTTLTFTGAPDTGAVIYTVNLGFRTTATEVTQISGGGTGAITAAAARTNLGVAIGTDVQPYNANIQNHISNTSNPHSTTADQVLPAQGIHSGKFLTTNGTISSWGTVSETTVLPSQTSNGNKVLTTNGTSSQWSAGLTNVTVNKVTFTAPATGSTLTIADGKTLTANNSVTIKGKESSVLVGSGTVTLTDAASITWDTANGNVATVTLTATGRTLANPTNLDVGSYVLIVKQDAGGSKTITTWGNLFKWPAGVVPVLSTTANAVDVFSFIYDGSVLYGSYILGAA